MSKVEILQQKGYNFLWIDDYLWMWDLPAEVEIQEDIAREAFGDVLVVGYGLGIVQKFLCANDSVTFRQTVELYPEVILECKRVFGKVFGAIVYSDFHKLRTLRKFNCIIGDICPEISSKYLDEYVKFKTHAQTLLREDGKILTWGQDYYEYLIEKERVTV